MSLHRCLRVELQVLQEQLLDRHVLFQRLDESDQPLLVENILPKVKIFETHAVLDALANMEH